jgi:hypothetical protein
MRRKTLKRFEFNFTIRPGRLSCWLTRRNGGSDTFDAGLHIDLVQVGGYALLFLLIAGLVWAASQSA